MSGPILLSFLFWVLLTADFSWVNLTVGALASVAVAFLPKHKVSAWRMSVTGIRILTMLPAAVGQAIQIMVLPHRYERIYSDRLEESGNAWKVFEAVFLITLTPKSLAISEVSEEKINVHELERKTRS
ncbi:Na+/H+ antiporter subunit E [Desulfoferrobacter suflitae]|uniref:Na+/H+ antiporter subunit E n=1 Tax=Desulfoferrobacter suflitae TaxID=2865782 RepID=UPI002164CC49|nr:Na+/H+ antiporter subunit E [Desulfoferrobacter suflitae]MCK8600364.1 Na+/H+ antiporter subunit E [Desulfoferrobacter suflitae]